MPARKKPAKKKMVLRTVSREKLPEGTVDDESLAENLWGDTKRFLKAAVVDPLVDIKNLAGEFTKPVPEDSPWNFPNVLDPRIGHTLGEMARGIIRSHADEGREAYEASQRGNIGEMMKHGTAAAVPMFGPILEDIGTEAYESGDYATGLGRLAELVIPFPKGTKGRAALTKPRPPKYDIPLTRAERYRAEGQTGVIPAMTAFAENVAERTVAGAGPYTAFRKTQQDAVRGAVDKILDPLGPVEPSQVGRNVLADLEKTQSKRKKINDALYKDADDAAQGVMVDTAAIKRAATELDKTTRVPWARGTAGQPGALSADIAAIAAADEAMLARRGGGKNKKKQKKRDGQIVSTRWPKTINGWVATIKAMPGRISFRDAKDVRANLLETGRQIARDPSTRMPAKAATDFGEVPNVVGEAMETSAQRAGNPGAFVKYRTAQDFYKETRDMLQNDVIKAIDDTKTKSKTQGVEHIAEVIRDAPEDRVKLVYGMLTPEVQDQVRAQILTDILNKSSKKESVTTGATSVQKGSTWESGSPVPGLLTEPFQGELSGFRLQQAMEGLKKGKLNALFGPKLTSALKELSESAQRIGDLGGSPVPGLVAATINSGLIFGWLIRPLYTAATGAGMSLVSKVLLRQPKSIPTYKKFISALTSRDSRAALVLASQLQDMFDQEQEASMPREMEETRQWFRDNPPSLVPTLRVPPQGSRIKTVSRERLPSTPPE